VNIAKAERTHEGFRVLRERIAEIKPDVMIVFSDDQLECFDFTNYPAFAIYVGETFRKSPREGSGDAVALLKGVMKRGFDPAFSMDMPKPDRGLAGGVIRTCEELTDWETPVVPVMMNLYFAPQPTGMRCYQFGKAVREAIEEFPGDLRVAVVGSGGLWHTPGAPNAWLDVEFDLRMLDYLKEGKIQEMAQDFDAYVIPPDDESQDTSKRGRNTTGMPSPGGPALGTRETCAWIAAAAVADGRPNTVVDYIPVYASPVGNAFAFCDKV
jgi:hypothetical protein